MGAKGKKRQKMQQASLEAKRASVREKKQSKYAMKKASGPTPNSPSFYDPNDPTHETVEEVRKREFSNTPSRNYVREDTR